MHEQVVIPTVMYKTETWGLSFEGAGAKRGRRDVILFINAKRSMVDTDKTRKCLWEPEFDPYIIV